MIGDRLWATVLLVAFLVVRGSAQQTNSAPPAMAPPKVACAAPSWDFGRAANSSTVEHVFELANEGGAELQIQKVSTGCGCTAARAGADRVGSGGKTQVSVSLSLAGRTGRQRKSIYVHTNDPERPILMLEMSGEALGGTGGQAASDPAVARDGRPHVTPERIDFGRVKADAASEAEIVLMGASSNDAVKVEGIETGTASLVAKVESGKAGECRVALRLSPGAELGAWSSTVTIRTAHPVLRDVTVPVAWKAEGDLQAIPEEVVVIARPGATNAVVRYVAVRSRTGKPVAPSGVSCDDPNVKAEASPLPGGKGILVKASGILAPVNRASPSIVVRTADGVRLTVPIVAVAFPDGNPMQPASGAPLDTRQK